MRLNLTNDEAGALAVFLADCPAEPQLVQVRDKIAAALKGEGERDEFRVGDVLATRVRGEHLEGYDRRSTSKTHYGWVLKHLPSGRRREIPPERHSGVSALVARRWAETFDAMCKKEYGRNRADE